MVVRKFLHRFWYLFYGCQLKNDVKKKDTRVFSTNVDLIPVDPNTLAQPEGNALRGRAGMTGAKPSVLCVADGRIMGD